MFNADVKPYEFYLEKAFRRAKKAADATRKTKFPDKIIKYRTIEINRVNTVYQVIDSDIKKILNEFPKEKELTEFYRDLVNLISDYKTVSKACRKLAISLRLIKRIYSEILTKLKRTKDPKKMAKLRKEFYGRVASILKRNKEYFLILMDAERKLKKLPNVKMLPTIVISGLPNVGKSTLLKKLTGSEPEIQPYPFTTKGLMLGYIKTPYVKLQIVDTPGLLDRDFEEMNKIEKQAVLAISKLANLVIYIFDLTETCGFPLENQKKLFNQILRNFNKEIVIYLSKTDIYDENHKKMKEVFKKDYQEFLIFDNSEKLKEWIVNDWIRKRKDLWV